MIRICGINIMLLREKLTEYSLSHMAFFYHRMILHLEPVATGITSKLITEPKIVKMTFAKKPKKNKDNFKKKIKRYSILNVTPSITNLHFSIQILHTRFVTGDETKHVL